MGNCQYRSLLLPEVSLLNKSLQIKTSFMFLQLNHQKLDVYTFSKQFVLEYYKLSKMLPQKKGFRCVHK